jgi:hypothetical protein
MCPQKCFHKNKKITCMIRHTEQTFPKDLLMDGWVDGWMNGWMDGWMVKRLIHGWMYGW